MIFSTQYYRPPFPNQRFWSDDMRAIRRAGLNTVYLWACWGWIEPEPDSFRWDDYDRLIEEAAAAGLDVVLNTIAEIQPFWIHREIPDSHMVDHTGRTVGSSLRGECNVGLTPGGCTDHPHVRERMRRFLAAIAERYAGAENLVAWDLWNETRWAVSAGGYVCYCSHTVAEYRRWLDARHGGLEGLNAAWKRRYCSWDDVQPPAGPDRPYVDLLEFQAFLTWRSREHMRFRYDELRTHDTQHIVAAHAMSPATTSNSYPFEQALSRGNDWDYLEFLDGFGCSHFPAWFATSAPECCARLEASRSAAAAAGKLHWVGELQGGSARDGIEVRPPVRGSTQQRWVWTAVARGAKAISFWCWRDEVFARESSGFGIVGNDGHAADRLERLAATGALLDRHGELFDTYVPDPGRVGVVFDPAAYYLDWAQYGDANEQAAGSLAGYLHALERLQVPYEVIEARRHAPLASCRVLLMPWPLHVEPGLAAAVADWVRAGGTLLVESELDAYDGLGFYRYPGERPFARQLGIRSLGRRPIDSDRPGIGYAVDGVQGELRPEVWLEPLDADGVEVLAAHDEGALAVRRAIGSGQVIALGTFAGLAASHERSEGLERLVGQLVRAGGGSPDLACSVADGELVQWRLGRAGDERLLFVTNCGPAERLSFRGDAAVFAGAGEAKELATGRAVPVLVDGAAATVAIDLPADGSAILRWRAPAAA